MLIRQTKRWRQFFTLFGICSAVYYFLFVSNVIPVQDIRIDQFKVPSWVPSWTSRWPSSFDLFNTLNLDEAQCEAAFPGLTDDIKQNVERGPFSLKPGKVGDVSLQAQIKDGKFYILRTGVLPPELMDGRNSALHQIHRAILTSPDPLPDTVFAFTVGDQPLGAAFTYTRPAYAAPVASLPHIVRAFLMPHFSFWAWPVPVVGTFSRAARAIDQVEASVSFADKDPRAVWRGTIDFNSVHNPRLRADLVRIAAGKPWADVRPLEWHDGPLGFETDGVSLREGEDKGAFSSNATGVAEGTNAMMIEDFCRYKYVLHTEGVTYSGRLQFLQMCASVIITPPMAWLQHTTHLIKPLFSSSLGLDRYMDWPWDPTEGEKKAWPVRYRPDEANMVFVRPDWSDLGDTVAWLEKHPTVAEGIAKRQRELFVGKGYFSPAAEACYWRALIRGWSKMVQLEGDGWDDLMQQGVEWEIVALGHRG